MDTSKNYIKMCRKADEIRANWKPKLGDYFYGVPLDIDDMDYDRGVYRFLVCEDEFYNVVPDTYDYKKKEFNGIGDENEAVFLPRQDDLQDMIDYELPSDLVKDFYKWCSELEDSMLERLKTMEQLWMGYVMLVNYSKIWTGRDWEHTTYAE